MVELAFEQHRFWDVRRWKEGGFTEIGRMQITKKEDGSFLYERKISRWFGMIKCISSRFRLQKYVRTRISPRIRDGKSY